MWGWCESSSVFLSLVGWYLLKTLHLVLRDAYPWFVIPLVSLSDFCYQHNTHR